MRSLSFAAIIAFLGTGCLMNDGGAADDGKADGTNPIGTFVAPLEHMDHIAVLTLKTDNTFYRLLADDPSAEGAQGTYKLSKSGTTRYLKLLDASGDQLARYAYTYRAAILKLKLVGTDEWFALEISDVSFCAEAADCELQNLPEESCTGEWACEESSCVYACGAEDPTPCATSGGTCVEFPAPCEGVIRTESRFSCGDDAAMECCVVDSECVPTCMKVGTDEEGLYDSCTGDLLCWIACGNNPSASCRS